MELKERPSSEDWTRPSTFGNELQQNWGDAPSILDYSMRSKLNQPSENSPLLTGNSNNQTKTTNQQDTQIDQIVENHIIQEWDPKGTLNNLSFLEQKIHQLQELVHMIVKQKGQVSVGQDGQFTQQQQQQLITADLTSIIVQLISTAGSLLPSVNQSLFPSVNPQLNGVLFPSAPTANTSMMSENSTDQMGMMEEEHEIKDDDDGKEEEHLPPGSYEILQLEKEEILAPHTHFCTICGKGFKRDANLRMHMRGHGDEYKTHAALAKPNKESCSEQMLLKRYSCPSAGCKRNKEHKKFQPLKTILCVKNHYKRTHCDKSYICSRCHTKKFSVIADLKTHEKHCGRDKWLCSCGTTFSRKDKLFGHIALFQGHTPAIPIDENKGTSGTLLNPGENCEANNKLSNLEFSFGSNSGDGNGVKENVVEDPYFSLFNYDCSLSGLQDFPQANFDDSSCSFSFLISREKNGMQSLPSDID